MRRLARCVAFSSIVPFGQMTFAAGPSFSDAAKQVQTNQQACLQPDKSYDPSCIKKLSADYAALHQAAALTSQQIDSNNPLAALAQDKMKQYQQVQDFIHDNALELISGSTYINPDWLKPTRAQVESGAGPVPVETTSSSGASAGVSRTYIPLRTATIIGVVCFPLLHAWSMQSKRFASTTPSCLHSELETHRSEAIQPFSYWQARLMLSDHNERERSRVAVQFGFGPEEPATSSQGLSALA